MTIDGKTIPKAPGHELGLKDALRHAGLIEASEVKRGRPSRQFVEWGEALVREGYLIKGMTISSTPAIKTEETKPAEVKRVKRGGTEIAELIPQMRGEDVIPYVNGKPWRMGIKGTCNLCGNSLTHCPCPKPMVFLDYKTSVAVDFRVKGVSA